MRFSVFLLLIGLISKSAMAQVQLNVRLVPFLENGPATAECQYDSQARSAHLKLNLSTFQVGSAQIHLRWTGVASLVFYRPIARLNDQVEPWRSLPPQKYALLDSARGSHVTSFEIWVENAAPDFCQTRDFRLVLTQTPS